jgi:membrane protease YdiL (CAAX protease family)
MTDTLRRIARSLSPLLFLLGCAVVFAGAGAFGNFWPQQQALATSAIAVIGTLGLTGFALKFGNLTAGEVGLVPDRGTPVHLLGGALLGFGLVALHMLVLAAAGHVTWHWNPAISAATFCANVALYVLLAHREELAYRGWAFRTLTRQRGALAAQLVIALLFAAEHVVGGVPWEQALLGAGVGSLAFGAAALRSGGLAMPIAFHAAWNIADWARGSKNATGFLLPAVQPGFERSTELISLISYVSLMATATTLILFWGPRRNLGA